MGKNFSFSKRVNNTVVYNESIELSEDTKKKFFTVYMKAEIYSGAESIAHNQAWNESKQRGNEGFFFEQKLNRNADNIF